MVTHGYLVLVLSCFIWLPCGSFSIVLCAAAGVSFCIANLYFVQIPCQLQFILLCTICADLLGSSCIVQFVQISWLHFILHCTVCADLLAAFHLALYSLCRSLALYFADLLPVVHRALHFVLLAVTALALPMCILCRSSASGSFYIALLCSFYIALLCSNLLLQFILHCTVCRSLAWG